MFNEDLAAHLAGESLTLAYAWLVTARNGKQVALTNHDQPLSFAGHTFEPGFGFDGSAASLSAQMRAGHQSALGFLSSDNLSEAELAAGVWDRARVEVYAVNWKDPQMHQLLRRGELGEVERDSGTFRAEFRSLAAQLSEVKGRVLAHGCHADLGDKACGVDLTKAPYRHTVSLVKQPDDRKLHVSLTGDVEQGWWTNGHLTMTTGPYANVPQRIAAHDVTQGTHELTLWLPLSLPLELPLSSTLTAGCDKSWAQCQQRFANALNFRGFPHMPGNDFVLAGPSDTSAQNDASPWRA